VTGYGSEEDCSNLANAFDAETSGVRLIEKPQRRQTESPVHLTPQCKHLI
jgi:hypothetical protein